MRVPRLGPALAGVLIGLSGLVPIGASARDASRATTSPDIDPLSAPTPAPLERVSVSSTGAQGEAAASQPDVDATGRYVVFSSSSATLVPGDTNGASDVFIRDRQLGTTERLSVTSSGGEADGDDFAPAISADGRFVAFRSRARNLDARDTNSGDDIYVHDRQTGVTELISVTLSNTGSNQVQTSPSINGDGRFVAFTTCLGGIVAGDEPFCGAYVRDRNAGTSELASVATDGHAVSGFNPSISDDGAHVAFDSGDSGIDPADTNGSPDVFVRDRDLGTTQLVSRGPAGQSVFGESSYARISSDGNRVVFLSYANWGLGRPQPGVYLRDRQAATTVRVDVAPGGTPQDIESGPPDLSGDGRLVIFRSNGTDLAPGSTNGWFETYLADVVGHTIDRISIAADGGVQSGGSYTNAMSANGSVAVFTSDGSNLVANDTNGVEDVFAKDLPTPLTIDTTMAAASTVPKLGRFEKEFRLSRTYGTDANDPDLIDVSATFTAPSGVTYTTPAFFGTDYTLRPGTGVGGSEFYDPVPATSGGVWHARFSPDETGTWQYTLKAQDRVTGQAAIAESAPMTFAVTSSTAKGQIERDPRDDRFLRYGDGSPYLPMGHNVAFGDGNPPNLDLSAYYEPHFQSMQAAGQNWARVWMTDFYITSVEWSATHWSGQYGGVGQYADIPAFRVEEILNLAEQHGLEVQLVLNDHGQFSSWVNQRWNDNPYNELNGGPVPDDDPAAFFSNPTARGLFKQRLHYLVARYAAYRDILAWELFNEVQFIGSVTNNPFSSAQVREDVVAWHAEMAAYLRSLDPYHHLITTSSDIDTSEAQIWNDPNIDLIQVHDYGPLSGRDQRFRGYGVNLNATYGKPVIVGEFGLSGDPEAGFDPTTSSLPPDRIAHLVEATHLHNSAWASAMSASGAMSWWWGGYIRDDASRHRTPPDFPANERINPPLRAFFAGEDLAGMSLHPSNISAPSTVVAMGQDNGSAGFAWIRDAQNEYGSGVGPGDLVGRTMTGVSIAFDGFADGLYRVEVHDPWSINPMASQVATASGGTLSVTLPTFTRDLAIKVSPSSAAPPGAPTNVTAAAGDAQASISWGVPVSDGGDPINSYTVTASPGESTALVAGDVTTATITGLTNGTAYTFTVTAANATGTGPASSPSNSVTPVAGAPAPDSTQEMVPPSGGTATTDPANAGPSPADPVTTSVTVPATSDGGSVTIAETAVSETPPTGGYQFLGQQIDITSTAATSASNPLTIVFTIDSSAIRAAFGLGSTDALPAADQVDVTRAEGTGSPTVIPACTSASPPIAPDPCITSRQYVNDGDDLQITVRTGSASHWNTAIKPAAVTVTNSGYSPKAATVVLGGTIVWTFAGSKFHSATDNLKLGPAKAPLFNSGPLVSGRYGYVFRAAGTYTYGSTVKGDPGSFAGSIGVPVRVGPASGGTTTTFTVTWSSAALPGYVFDVQYRFMKAGTKSWSGYKAWQTGASGTSGAFVPPTGKGSYTFSARLRNAATGMASLWSPEVAILVR
jgi:plastocyanin